MLPRARVCALALFGLVACSGAVSAAGDAALIDDATISGKITKTVFERMLETGRGPDEIVEAEGLRQVTDTGAVEAIVRAVLEANPTQVNGYRSGKLGLKGFLVGQVMKQTGGKANPGLVNELLDRILAEG